MDSDRDYEFDVNAEGSIEGSQHNGMEGTHSSLTSEDGEDYNSPPVLSPIHAMDIPSVRSPPVSVMIPADRASAHDLPLAETLSAANRGLFHTIVLSCRVSVYLGVYTVTSSLFN